MADISPTTTGLVVSGAGALLTAVFGLALKMLVMSDRKDDASYARIVAERDRLETALDKERKERDAERRQASEDREALRALLDAKRDELEQAHREIAMWRERR